MKQLAGDVDNSFRIEAWGDTHVGMKRPLNEDVFLLDTDSGVFLVADGMGGHAAGEVASRVATEEIVRSFKTTPGMADETWPEAELALVTTCTHATMDT